MDDIALGFKAGDLDAIIGIISNLHTITKASVFGSRAKGNYQKGSDVDIVIWSASEDDALQLRSVLNDETLLPYKFDVINYYQIDNRDLKEHVDRQGVIIYQTLNVNN